MSKQATLSCSAPRSGRHSSAGSAGRKTERRLLERARVILLAAGGERTDAIATQFNTTPSRVSKWRTRFAAERLAALGDRPRSGALKRYDKETRKRILALLDEPPPDGHATWTGELLSGALGEVSKHQLWRVLRTHQISLRRRRSWCVSTDPEFVRKAANVVGLYLDPPKNTVVSSVDEVLLERRSGPVSLRSARH